MLRKIILIVFGLIITISLVSATTTKLSPIDDSYIDRYTSYKDSNYGSSQTLKVYNLILDGNSYQQRALFKFDLSQIPSGAQISSAKLSLYENYYKINNLNIPLEIKQIKDWDDNWEEEIVTYNNRPSYGVAPGGPYYSYYTYNQGELNQRIIDITPFIQNESMGNRIVGILVDWDTTATTDSTSNIVNLFSKESQYSSNIYLEITYTSQICKTFADTNCDNIVSRAELSNFITKWTGGQATRTELGNAIMAWVNG